MFKYVPWKIEIKDEEHMKRTVGFLEESEKVTNVRIDSGFIKYEQYQWVDNEER